MDKYRALKEYFGHDSFRPGQEEVINNILAGRDVLGIMPTGAGKSMCYQIPALISDGVTVVVSPLISLMKDQVGALVQSGVKAAYLNSSLTFAQQAAVRRNILNGMYKIVYISPERLITDGFLDIAEQIKISVLAVDEAHCISQWGQDFRPSYLKIKEFIDTLSYRPTICALTATATDTVRQDIIRLLNLNNPFTIVTGFDRKNLYFEVQRPKNKFNALLDILKENKDESTIIYCSTRKNVEDVSMRLSSLGYDSTKYHAGLEDEERRKNQDDFLFDRRKIMVATNAFGMGIDKSNVTLVVHYNMPKNIESYYQEAGRAGRDGSSSKCILLYNAQDIRTIQFFIDNPDDNEEMTPEMREEIRKRDMERLRAMKMYCITGGCLREYMLRYFGEHSPSSCGNCGSCLGTAKTVDVSLDAQKIISCVFRIERRGKSCGKILLSEILHGSENQRISKLGLDTISTYGIMSDTPQKQILNTIDLLIMHDYLSVNGDFSTIETNNMSMRVIKENPKLSLIVHEKKKKNKLSAVSAANTDLFEALKKLRVSKAVDAGLPAYCIFPDATLREMADKLPVTAEEFLDISGVGKAKLNKYGEDFMDCIKNFLSEKS